MMKAALAGLFGLFVILLPKDAQAHTTYLASLNDDEAYFIDESLIKQDDRGRKQVWLKIINIEEPAKASDISYTLQLDAIDCFKGTSRIIKFTEFPLRGNPQTMSGAWAGEQRIVPGSVYEGVKEFVCEGKRWEVDRTKYDPEDVDSMRHFSKEVLALLE